MSLDLLGYPKKKYVWLNALVKPKQFLDFYLSHFSTSNLISLSTPPITPCHVRKTNADKGKKSLRAKKPISGKSALRGNFFLRHIFSTKAIKPNLLTELHF